jgi:uncharacterized protein YgfB (UPF0149 family)
MEWIKQQFIATVGVLFPTGEFVKNCQGYTFLELAMVICGKTDDESRDLQAECLVEIFRYMRIRPILC